MKALQGKELGLTVEKERLLTVKEVSGFLRVSERWIHKQMEKRTFPIRWYPIGGRNKGVSQSELDDWLRKIVVEAGTAPLPKAVKKVKEGAK